MGQINVADIIESVRIEKQKLNIGNLLSFITKKDYHEIDVSTSSVFDVTALKRRIHILKKKEQRLLGVLAQEDILIMKLNL